MVKKRGQKLQTYRIELIRISKEKGLTAHNVVEEAQNTSSPLHNFFDWDDVTASHKWRLQQARVLINVIIEPIDASGDRFNSFEIIKTDIGKKYEYVYDILNNEDWRRQVIDKAVSELSYWREKYRKFFEFDRIFREIDVIKKEVIKDVRKERRGSTNSTVRVETQSNQG